MKLYQITADKDDANNILNELGDLGVVQFLDLNSDESPFALPYT